MGNKTPDIFPILPLAFPSWEGLGVGYSCLLPLASCLLPLSAIRVFTTEIQRL
ncbi:hypothetical protein [Moorena sp. SIO3H5]|uniref:hypothetical protein n=1 Tax=Moorena sp. SIO3H5 TaxID=2607834 RepID=UPI0013B6C06F|nr:hypothetical protein [Moorena sp. SIO3H5]NEO68807.1 hypothetical protein [Moorena sp. SIO3H5]